MTKVACRYAVIQFVPYIETGEFANVGIALICPQTGYFGYKLQTRKSKRVTDFFDELPRSVFLRSIQGFKSELQRVADVIGHAPVKNQAEFVREVFDGLLHPREAILRFSAARVVLAGDPARELSEKFDHYVDRSFATQEYVEQEIEKRIKTLLGTLDLKQPFRPAKVGDDEVYARFPLVQRRGPTVVKVIKPFNLNQTDSMGIYDHGGTWLQRIQRLRKKNLLPHDVLFAVRGPAPADVKRHAAFQEICAELSDEDVLAVDEAAQDRIAEFALA